MSSSPTSGPESLPIVASAAYRDLIELVACPALVVDGPAAVVLDANLSAQAYFGIAADEFLGLSIEALCPVNQPDGGGSAQLYADFLRRALEEGEVHGISFHLRAEGGSQPCSVQLRRLGSAADRSPGDGHSVAICLTPLDEQGAYERDLLARSIQAAPVPVMAVRVDGSFRLANPAAYRALGYNEGELEALTVEQVDSTWAGILGDTSTRRILAGGRCLRRQSVQRGRDGSELAVRLTLFQLRHAEEELYFAFAEPVGL